MYRIKRWFFLTVAELFCALSAFSQLPPFSDHAQQPEQDTIHFVRENQIPGAPGLTSLEYLPDLAGTPSRQQSSVFAVEGLAPADASVEKSPSESEDTPGEGSKVVTPLEKPKRLRRPDFNRDIYYRNKLEFSLDAGYLPINIPFPLDIFVGDAYNTYPLQYTLVPIIASLRWHICGVGGPPVIRGNWDLTVSGAITLIPRGPESRYFAYIMGIRRNFVPRNWRVAPYFDVRLGLGNIDAQGPYGVPYAQGEDFTFTVNMGSGVRYNLSPRFAISGGLNFMHISNLDLSQGNGKPNWGIRNYGINVYGPMVGIDMQLRRHSRHAE